jgi:hypothetical protein
MLGMTKSPFAEPQPIAAAILPDSPADRMASTRCAEIASGRGLAA